MTFGEITAFLFLADVFLHVFTDLPEVYAETQTAIAGWRKILAVLDMPVEIVEPTAGVELPRGALSVEARRPAVLLPGGRRGAARHLAVGARPAATSRSSGETGCGKTTFVKLICAAGRPARRAGS